MIQKARNLCLIQTSLGHEYMETTEICVDLAAEEDRAEVIGAW